MFHNQFQVSISRSLCGMVNTGKGGTLFLGVTDEGRAEGFSMARYVMFFENVFRHYLSISRERSLLYIFVNIKE